MLFCRVLCDITYPVCVEVDVAVATDASEATSSSVTLSGAVITSRNPVNQFQFLCFDVSS